MRTNKALTLYTTQKLNGFKISLFFFFIYGIIVMDLLKMESKKLFCFQAVTKQSVV